MARCRPPAGAGTAPAAAAFRPTACWGSPTAPNTREGQGDDTHTHTGWGIGRRAAGRTLKPFLSELPTHASLLAPPAPTSCRHSTCTHARQPSAGGRGTQARGRDAQVSAHVHPPCHAPTILPSMHATHPCMQAHACTHAPGSTPATCRRVRGAGWSRSRSRTPASSRRRCRHLGPHKRERKRGMMGVRAHGSGLGVGRPQAHGCMPAAREGVACTPRRAVQQHAPTGGREGSRAMDGAVDGTYLLPLGSSSRRPARRPVRSARWWEAANVLGPVASPSARRQAHGPSWREAFQQGEWRRRRSGTRCKGPTLPQQRPMGLRPCCALAPASLPAAAPASTFARMHARTQAGTHACAHALVCTHAPPGAPRTRTPGSCPPRPSTRLQSAGRRPTSPASRGGAAPRRPAGPARTAPGPCGTGAVQYSAVRCGRDVACVGRWADGHGVIGGWMGIHGAGQGSTPRAWRTALNPHPQDPHKAVGDLLEV